MKLGLIPDAVIRIVERKLRNRDTLIAAAELRLYEEQQRAMALRSPLANASAGSGGSRRIDALENAALRVIRAEEQLEQARTWVRVISQVDSIFPRDTPEGQAAACLYENHMRIKEACAAAGCDRATFRHRRDAYVCHCALIAAGEGLIDLKGEKKRDE